MLQKILFRLIIKVNIWFPPWKLTANSFVLTDKLKQQIETIFFFGDVPGNANEEIFRTAAFVYDYGLTKTILINGLEAKKEFGQSAVEWTKRLKENGIDLSKILCFPPSKNTVAEAKAMIEYSKQKGWKTAVILAQPHRLVRCLRAVVKAMEKEGYWMRIYFVYPKCNLFEKTAGSQNMFYMKRFLWIGWENSIFHNLFYGLPSNKKTVGYLERREEIV